MPDVLAANGIWFRYRSKGTWINCDVSLTIAHGEIACLLGPNGAGKTTLLRQIIGLERPTKGSLRIAGVNVADDPGRVAHYSAYLPQANLPLQELRVSEAFSIIGRLRALSQSDARKAAEREIGYWRLETLLHRQIGRLSGGEQRAVGLGLTMLAPRQLLVLDEPSNDLAPEMRVLLWSRLQELSTRGTAILLVTHNVREVEQVVSRLFIMVGGRIRTDAQSAPTDLGEEVYLCVPSELVEFISQLGCTATESRLCWRVSARNLLGVYASIASALGPKTLAEIRIERNTLERRYLEKIGEAS
jgi:ABC-2 type transport system ATP-binding protein